VTFAPRLIQTLRDAADQASNGAAAADFTSSLQLAFTSAVDGHFSEHTTLHAPIYATPQGAPTRMKSNGSLPLPIVHALKAVRDSRRLFLLPGIPQAQALAITAGIIANHRTAVSAARRFHRQYQARLRRLLEGLRIDSPHELFRFLRAVIPQHDHRVSNAVDSIPSKDGFPPAVERFTVHNRDLCLEQRPPPPAITSPAAMEHCPSMTPEQASRWSPALAADIKWQEIYLAVFPVSTRPDVATIHVALGHHPACKHCAHMQAALDAWDRNDPDTTAPKFTPCLHTSTSPGPDGIAAEFIRWTRTEHGSDRHEHRRTVCQLLARIFNRLLQDGDVPHEGFAESRTVPIRKKTAPNQVSDPADPDQYRAITMGNLIPKILSLVIDARLLH